MDWTLPTPVGREAAIATPAGAVVAGGLIAGDRSTARAYRIQLPTGRRTALPRLGIAVHDAAGGQMDGHLFVVGGGSSSEQSAVQQLSRTRAWTAVGRLPQPRSDLVVATVGDRLVVMGGFDGTGSPVGIVALSPTGHPSVVGALEIGVRYPAVAVAKGAVWLFGGEHNGHLVTAIQRVDTESWRSSVVGHLKRPLAHSAAAVMDGRILLAGGRTGPSSVTSHMWWFDLDTSSLRRAGRLPYPLADTGVVTTPNALYLLGGETPTLTKRVVCLVARP
jgi:N-acetylneuraminic acid mutarotase